MSELKIFENAELGNVRVVQKSGEPWFVAKDVADALGYAWAGSATIKHIPTEWVGVNSEFTPSGKQTMLTLSEQGLYFFLGRSDKSKALPYQKWIAGEVVPSIRKTGSYEIGIPKTYAQALRAAADAHEAMELAQATTKAALAERNHAIKTKAEIGERREATAMATASVAVRELDRVKQQIGDSTQYKQVKAIPWLKSIFKKPIPYSLIGKKLKALSFEMGVPVKEIEHTEHGKVGAYHIDVIQSFWHKLMADISMMGKYR